MLSIYYISIYFNTFEAVNILVSYYTKNEKNIPINKLI